MITAKMSDLLSSIAWLLTAIALHRIAVVLRRYVWHHK